MRSLVQSLRAACFGVHASAHHGAVTSPHRCACSSNRFALVAIRAIPRHVAVGHAGEAGEAGDEAYGARELCLEEASDTRSLLVIEQPTLTRTVVPFSRVAPQVIATDYRADCCWRWSLSATECH